MKRNLKMSNEVIKRILLSNREYHGAGRENGDGLYLAGYQHSSEVIFLPPPASVDSCFCLYRNTCTNNTLLSAYLHMPITVSIVYLGIIGPHPT